MYKSDSFNSTGSVVSFETLNNNNQGFGVSVTGTQCGVYGESSIAPIGTRPSPKDVPDGTGVNGQGDNFGVRGRSGDIGVCGRGRVGVFGEGASIGVSGLQGSGLQGGTASIHAVDAAIAAEAFGNPKTCVMGLRAFSQFNRAGVFYVGPDNKVPDLNLKSGEVVAQIHLVPLAKHQTQPPSDGQAGDLIAFRGEPVDQDEVQLYFCQKSSTDTQTAIWKRIA